MFGIPVSGYVSIREDNDEVIFLEEIKNFTRLKENCLSAFMTVCVATFCATMSTPSGVSVLACNSVKSQTTSDDQRQCNAVVCSMEVGRSLLSCWPSLPRGDPAKLPRTHPQPEHGNACEIGVCFLDFVLPRLRSESLATCPARTFSEDIPHDLSSWMAE